MYEAFFGLREKPFALTPNTGFMVQLATYQACLNLLRVALAEGEGFIKVTGEVGTGKTLLCRALLNELDSTRYQVAWLPNPTLTPMSLRQALAHELHIANVADLDNHGLLAALHERLIELAGQGKSTVLLIDEAQALPTATLEALRLLTNLETEHRKLLQVVLFGQPELDATLAREDFRQLRQRITFPTACVRWMSPMPRATCRTASPLPATGASPCSRQRRFVCWCAAAAAFRACSTSWRTSR